MSTAKKANQPDPERRVYLEESHGNVRMLMCPICGDANVHMEKVTVLLQGKDNYEAHPGVRGDVICLPGYCESQCLFTLILGFHKGSTYVWGEKRRARCPDCGKESEKVCTCTWDAEVEEELEKQRKNKT